MFGNSFSLNSSPYRCVFLNAHLNFSKNPLGWCKSKNEELSKRSVINKTEVISKKIRFEYKYFNDDTMPWSDESPYLHKKI